MKKWSSLNRVKRVAGSSTRQITQHTDIRLSLKSNPGYNTVLNWQLHFVCLQYLHEKFHKKTIKQIKKWKIKYNQIVFGKLSYDLLIDDKVINSKNLINLKNILKFLK